MCEVGKGEGRGVVRFCHVQTIAFWWKISSEKLEEVQSLRDVQKLRFTCEGGWARVEGAQGKIKGGGVTTMLTHCLHIVFRNTTAKGRGVTVLA